MKAILLSLLLLLTCSNSKINDDTVIQKDYEKVSLVTLIANPDKYHNQKIWVKGYVKIENEGEAIYINEDDYKYYIFKNAISLVMTDSLIVKEKINYGTKGYATVKGIFNKNRLGHYNSFSGSISQIEYIDWREGRKE